jgi:hypothetical protein
MEWIFSMSSLEAKWILGCKRIMPEVIKVVRDAACKLREKHQIVITQDTDIKAYTLYYSL